MRQGQQNRRGRGRNHNNGNRRSQNPLSRHFQSSGPDGKISGTADVIASRYMSLARDAAAAGDPVLAENYMQHAEHYYRIILAYREQLAAQGGEGQFQGGNRPRIPGQGEGSDPVSDEPIEGEDLSVLEGEAAGGSLGFEPQPRMFDAPPEGAQPQGGTPTRRFDEPRGDTRGPRPMRERPQQGQSRNGHDRNDRGRNRGRYQDRFGDQRPYGESRGQERGGDRNRYDRQDRANPRPEIEGAPERTPEASVAVPEPEGFSARPEPPVRTEAPEGLRRRREEFRSVEDQPEFLRRPVRRPRREALESAETEAPSGERKNDGDSEVSND